MKARTRGSGTRTNWLTRPDRILFLKSTSDDGDNKMPLHDKLVLIFKERMKKAKTDQDRATAERDLEKVTTAGDEDQ